MKKFINLQFVVTFFTCMILTFTVLPTFANKMSPQKAEVNIVKESITIKNLIEQIEKQTIYLFAYSKEDIDVNKVVNIKKGNQTVESLLNEALPKVNLEYTTESNYIILKVKAAPAKRELVTGVVLDENGKPMQSVVVSIKGTTIGKVTYDDGKYDIDVAIGETLQFTFIGYKTQYIKVGKGSLINVNLELDALSIDEVVVTALGIKRSEKALGYATQKVKGDAVATVKSINVATSLTGKIAGLNVTNSTEFNSAPSIKLRGETPLLVVDGVPFGNMNLNDIAADDIESIDILKGATASALYGSRGSAGAIMVTTKKGKGKGLTVQVNSSNMFNAGYLVLPEVQSSYSSGQAGKFIRNADFVWGDKMDIGRTAVQYDPNTYEWGEAELVSKGKNNFKNFLEPGFVTHNNISISQSGEHGSFRSSLSHVYNKGQYANQKLNKMTYSISGEMKFDKFSFEAGAIYNKRFYPNDQGAGYGGGGYIYNLLVWTGTDYDIRDYKNYWIREDEEQNWLYDSWYDNPYFLANEQTRSNDYDKINTYLSGKYEIAPWLDFSIRSGVDAYMSRTETQNPISARGGWNKKGYYANSKSTGFSMNNDMLLSANHKFGDFAVDGFVGGTLYYYADEYSSANTSNGLSIPGYYSLNASVDPVKASSSYHAKQVNSLFARAAISWKNAIFVDVTARNDWSSTLSEDTRSYFYPSVSGSVVLTEFFEAPSWLDFWKVRGSWTQTKEDLSIYEINKAYNISTNVWDGLNTATYPTSIRSSTLEPTAAKAFEIGTSFNVWDNRLKFDVTYYNKLNYNLTRNATISDASGFESTLINYDEEQLRQGFEVAVSAKVIKSDTWNWDVAVNWARDRYTYSQVDDVYSTQKPWVAAGKRWDWYGVYDWERDPQGNIVHEAGMPVQSDYQSLMGNEYPDWVWGVNTTLRYKAWSLGLSFDGRVGGMAYSRTEQTMWNTGVHPESDNQWRYDEVVDGKINYVGTGVKVVSGKVEYDTYGGILEDTRVFAQNDQPVSYENYTMTYNPWSGGKVFQNVFDCTFFKLREMSVGYDIPKSVTEKLNLKNASISFVGQNIFIWMKEFKNADPDVDSDNMNSPSMRYLGFNIKLNF